ncbi:MAG TPA: hypothetical protein PKE30_12065 [Niabella sp.]|nr:hypothetical protein [Niabella sp.]
MKTYIKIILVFASVLVFTGCKKKEFIPANGNGPQLSVSKEYEKIEGINVGDQVIIPVTAASEKGVKRLSYYFITQTANGTSSGTPVNIDKEREYPRQINENITFTIVPNMLSLVIVSFDGENRASEVHITMSEIRALPILAFKEGIKYEATVFENKKLNVEGQVTSEHDIESLTYKTVINGVSSAGTAIPFTDKKNTPFVAAVTVPKGLTAVIIEAKNIYDGIAVDTFKIGAVTDDAVNISLTGFSGSIPHLYADSLNVLNGKATSGSDITSLSYAVKANGTYSAEQPLPLGTPLDEFNFSIELNGSVGMQAIRITGRNNGGKEQVIEYPIQKVNRRLLRFTNIVLTSEIGPGKNNWFSAWKAPHVFDVTNAAANQEWIDFGTIVYNNASFRFVPPFIYTAGTAYLNSAAPYMVGFNKATYTMVTANRRSVTPAAMDTLRWDSNLENFINRNIKGPGPVGENYNVTTTNRRVSGDPVVNAGFIIGWGSWNLATSVVDNQAFGVVIVKSYTTTGSGKGTVTLDIIVPAEDQRSRFNPVSMFGYPTPQ